MCSEKCKKAPSKRLILGANFMKRRFYEGFLSADKLQSCLRNCLLSSSVREFKEKFTSPFKKELSENMKSARNHLNKYLNDLKLHFDLNDKQISEILISSYRLNKPQNPFVKCLSMLKYWN